MKKGNRQFCLAVCNYAVLLFNLVFVCACAATEWEYEIQNKTIWLLLSIGLLLAVLILSGILFARAEGGKWKKRGIEVCTIILAFPVCLFLIFGGVLIGFDDVSEQSFVSPGGRYKAVLTSVDAGTFGGVTEVSVYETDQWISLPFGTLKHLRYRDTRGWIPRDELNPPVCLWRGQGICGNMRKRVLAFGRRIYEITRHHAIAGVFRFPAVGRRGWSGGGGDRYGDHRF
ncbi:hypothetical protein [Eubacterium sp. AB3007]|uniref:hypothetical protein n=1 Tax=Eubacterium sp. AB3007 TaxID=1392487 RepID=UPI00048577D3|nr:hypothetical protein [Eubacterium sp. AB3007]